MQISYPANIYVINALKESIKELERTIENCGALTHKDAKQSDSAKSYFKKQSDEAENIIIELHKQIASING